VSNSRRRTTWAFGGPGDATALGLGALFAALVAVSLWATAMATTAQFVVRTLPSPESLFVVSAAVSLVGLGGGALTYAHYRGIDISLGRPRDGSCGVSALAVVGPAAVAGGTALVNNTVFGTPLSSLLHRFVSPEASVASLVWVMGLPSVFLGAGLGLLFCALVPERTRALVGAADAPAVATLLVAFFRLLPMDAVGPRLSVGNAVEFTASLVFGVAFAMAVGILYRRAERADGSLAFDTGNLERRHLAVLALALVGVVGVGTGLTTVGELVVEALWVAAFGFAVLGYERSRSAWVPVLAMAGFTLALDVVVYAEALAGVSGV
jgi:hypothetical protein